MSASSPPTSYYQRGTLPPGPRQSLGRERRASRVFRIVSHYLAVGSPPASNNASTTERFALRAAAQCRGVEPSSSRTSTSAPTSNKTVVFSTAVFSTARRSCYRYCWGVRLFQPFQPHHHCSPNEAVGVDSCAWTAREPPTRTSAVAIRASRSVAEPTRIRIRPVRSVISENAQTDWESAHRM